MKKPLIVIGFLLFCCSQNVEGRGFTSSTSKGNAIRGIVEFAIWAYENILEFLFYWFIAGFVLIVIYGIYDCCKTRSFKGCGYNIFGCSVIVYPCISLPFGCIFCIPYLLWYCFKPNRCEFCGLSTSGCQDICQGEGHTIKCYNENRDTIDNFQDSDLYLCKRCQKCFKIWPKDLLNPKSECSKCNIKFRDDVQSQAHVCFTCQDYTIYNHLCQHHNFDESSEIIVVDFNDLDSIPANPEPISHV